MAGLTVYNGPPTGSLGVGGPSTLLQTPSNNVPIAAAPSQLQPSSNVMGYADSAPVYQNTAPAGNIGAATAQQQAAAAAQQQAAAQAAAVAAQQQAYRDQFNAGLTNTRTAGAGAFDQYAPQYRTYAEDLNNSVRTGQRNIDLNRQNTELGRMNGIQDILGFVRNGLSQGASRLANGNATESTAAGALQAAYSRLGGQRARGVNNQAALGQQQNDIKQNDLNLQNTQGVTNLHRLRDSQVNMIGNSVNTQLAALNQQAMGVGLPDRIAIDQEKQNIINAGQSKLAEVDNWLNDQLGTIHPQDMAGVAAQAAQMQQAGNASATPFDVQPFGQLSPVDSQPAIDQLPLFVRRRQIA